MPRQQKLKVYRTPIGFHDAYVAAPSRKAALQAWGSDADLFSRGVAEEVDDDELMREPLAHPGKVIRRSRGSIKEQLAALPPDRPKARKQGKAEEADPASARGGADVVNKATTAKPKSRPLPRPSRKSLEEAEKRLEVLIGRQREDDDDLRAREKVLADRRRDLEQVQARERNDAKQAVERERVAHSRAVSLWLEKQANAPP